MNAFSLQKKIVLAVFAITCALLCGFLAKNIFFWKDQQVVRMFRHLDPVFVPIEQVDPANIRVVAEYEIATLLYSPLIEYSNEGLLVGNIAEKFYWEGSDLVFDITQGLRSSRGDPITAKDVETSFKRLFILSTNSHGDLKSILCHGMELKKIDDPCPGIIAEGTKVRLRFDRKRHYLLPMLTSIDFAIIPHRALNSENLAIADYQNGTGPYRFVSQNILEEELIFEARPDHIRYKRNIPQKVQMKVWRDSNGKVFTSEETLELLKNDLIDFIPFGSLPDPESALNIINNSNDIRMFKTKNIALQVLIFTEKGKNNFSLENRCAVGTKIRNIFAKYYAKNRFGRVPTLEYFPPTGAGHLDQAEVHNLTNFFETKAVWSGTKKMKVSITTSAFELTKKILGENDEFELVPASSNPLFRQNQESDFPDAHLTVTDVSFNEDFNLLAYTESLKVFPYKEDENKEWLDRYMKEEEATVRLSMIRKLHLDMLKTAYIVPISSMPYIALSRKPWEMKFSDLFAGSSFWQIEMND